MLQAVWKKNDKKAKILIYLFSVVVFIAVVILTRIKLDVDMGFDVHLFAQINAIINTGVALLLIIALIAVKNKKFSLHRNLMMTAMILSVFFLISYICHHLLAGEAIYGDTDGVKGLSVEEMTAVGSRRTIYLIILFTHIPLAGIILPFILFSAYRALTGEFDKHKKLVRITWPIWFYVAVSGVIVYLMISPYYK